MIRRLFISFILGFAFALGADADIRSLYTVTDVQVSESAANVIEAQQRAFSVARQIAAFRMVERITRAEDRELAGGVYIDMATAQRLVAAVDVQEEMRGGGRYVATLAVVLNPPALRAYLTSLNIPFVDAQAPTGLLVPLASDRLIGDWQRAWKERNDGALAPYVTALLPYSQDVVWEDVQGEVGTARARRGLIAELGGTPGAYRVRVSTLIAGERALVGVTAPAASLEGAAAAASQTLDDAWKAQAIVNANGVRTVSNATVRYTSLPEWNALRSALRQSPLISDFQIKAISHDGAFIELAYAGDSERLIADLRQRGVAFQEAAEGWVMNSAVSSVR